MVKIQRLQSTPLPRLSTPLKTSPFVPTVGIHDVIVLGGCIGPIYCWLCADVKVWFDAALEFHIQFRGHLAVVGSWPLSIVPLVASLYLFIETVTVSDIFCIT